MSNASRLTEEERERMNNTVDHLLLRHLMANPCPLPPSKLAALYAAAMDPPALATWEATRHWWQITEHRPPVRSTTHAAVPLALPNGATVIMQIMGDTIEEEKFPLWSYDQPDINRRVDAAKVLGDMADEFVAWVNTACGVHTRQLTTKVVCHDIIELSGTVGQLHRMCPDLVRYTYDQTREALERQQRRSPVPYGWHNIDRRLVRQSMDHLALCYLLPDDAARDATTLGFTYNSNWIFCHNTLGSANGVSLPCYEQRALVSKYDLETEAFV